MNLQQIPKNDLLWTAFNMYGGSDQTKALRSEANRTVFAENFKTPQPPPLTTICLKVIAENYKGRPINLDIKPMQFKTFYDFIDTELPLEKCINIEDEYYWKRVYAVKCSDKMLLKAKSNEKDVCWKCLGVTLKLVELIENTPYEIWIPDEMDNMTKMVAPYVTHLKINKLQAMRETSFKKEPTESEMSVSVMSEEVEEEETEQADKVEYDYPMEDCHHVNLSVVKNLRQLHTLIVEFFPPTLDINYHSRYFNFSYVDVQQLASGVSELPSLKVFQIRRSRMDNVKLSIILEALKSIFVEHLEFYFCQLDDECGESLCDFLISTESLKHLNLSGNYFKDSAIDYLSNGIQNSPSNLTYLGLSNNPICDESMCNLASTLLSCEQLTHLTLSGVKVSELGAECVANLIKGHPNLEELEIIAVPMDGSVLVEAMEINLKIQQLLCQGCGLNLEEEFQIDLLLKRNRYIKENPYIGDTTKTEAEINEFVTKIKNPILINALAVLERHAECLRKQKELEKSVSEQNFLIEQIKASGDSESRKNAKELTEKDLDQRVTLYGQSEKNFFKRSSKKINQ